MQNLLGNTLERLMVGRWIAYGTMPALTARRHLLSNGHAIIQLTLKDEQSEILVAADRIEMTKE